MCQTKETFDRNQYTNFLSLWAPTTSSPEILCSREKHRTSNKALLTRLPKANQIIGMLCCSQLYSIGTPFEIICFDLWLSAVQQQQSVCFSARQSICVWFLPTINTNEMVDWHLVTVQNRIITIDILNEMKQHLTTSITDIFTQLNRKPIV